MSDFAKELVKAGCLCTFFLELVLNIPLLLGMLGLTWSQQTQFTFGLAENRTTRRRVKKGCSNCYYLPQQYLISLDSNLAL